MSNMKSTILNLWWQKQIFSVYFVHPVSKVLTRNFYMTYRLTNSNYHRLEFFYHVCLTKIPPPAFGLFFGHDATAQKAP